MQKLSLEQVTIDGFRGLRNLKLDGLGPLNILVGGNNSGKTSVLEALSILCNAYDPNEWLSMVRRRDFGGLDETRIQSLRWCFPQTGELAAPDYLYEGHCRMECKGGFPLRKLEISYRDILGEPSERELERMRRYRRHRNDAMEMEATWRGAEITHLLEIDAASDQPNLFGTSSYSVIEPVSVQFWEEDRAPSRRPMRSRHKNLPTGTLTPYSYQLNRLQVSSGSNQLFSKESSESVLEVISDFDPDIRDIAIASFRGDRPAIYLDHKRLGPAPLSVFGDALRRAVLLASTLATLKGGGVLMIDEAESGIHISNLKRVFTWLARTARRLGVQVIATTHSLEALDAIALSLGDQIDDLVTFHIDQAEDQTNVKRIAGDLLLRLRQERGLDVR